MAAAFQHIQRPPPAEPGAPGEFAFADRERVHAILSGAGFADIGIEPADMKIGGAALDIAVDTAISMGPISAALREPGQEAKRETVRAAVHEALAPFAGPDGVRLDAAVWIARAVNA
jgi:hypothetical protein